jgi:hypothetical protein
MTQPALTKIGPGASPLSTRDCRALEWSEYNSRTLVRATIPDALNTMLPEPEKKIVNDKPGRDRRDLSASFGIATSVGLSILLWSLGGFLIWIL